MTQYSKGQRSEGFPAPVAKVTSESPLWDWADVARWLFDHGKLEREAAIEAAVIQAANDAIRRGERKIGPILRKRISECGASL